MGVRQYVGARYVPIFGRTDEESILWDNSKPYEPLTIVLYQGNSYTSRQYVPIGIDINNEEFWALTGNYNAQVEQYRQEVRAFDGRITANANAIESEATARGEADTALQTAIDNEATARATADTALQTAIDNEATARAAADTTLQGAINAEATARATAVNTLQTAINTEATARAEADNALDSRIDELENATQTDILPLIEDLQKSERYHKCIVLGDSWCKGFYNGSEHETSALGNLIAQNLGIDSSNIVNKAISATGFLTGVTFNQQLNMCTEAELEGTDLILIIGGQNDKLETDPTPCKNAVISLLNNCTRTLPDADVHVFPMPFAAGRTFGTDETYPIHGASGTYAMFVGIREAINNMQHNNRVYMHDGCHRWAWSMGSAFSSDAWHLTAEGYLNWADIATMCIRGNCDWWPTRAGSWSGLTPLSDVQRNVVFEENGIINVNLIAQVAEVAQAGQAKVYLPDWCMSGMTRWIPNISPGHATALSLESGLHDGKVSCTFNMDNIPVDGWIMISFSWPAGL